MREPLTGHNTPLPPMVPDYTLHWLHHASQAKWQKTNLHYVCNSKQLDTVNIKIKVSNCLFFHPQLTAKSHQGDT